VTIGGLIFLGLVSFLIGLGSAEMVTRGHEKLLAVFISAALVGMLFIGYYMGYFVS